jgi:hypothetical protein
LICALKTGLDFIAEIIAMYKTVRTFDRPPCVFRFPLNSSLSLLIGATAINTLALVGIAQV